MTRARVASDAFNGQTVLVTGGTGFIGRHLIRRLETMTDCRILATTRHTPSHKLGPTRWLTTNLESLRPGFWKTNGVDKINLVLHFGGFAPKTGEAANTTERVFLDNLEGTRWLLDSLPGRTDKIILASTLDVYATAANEEAITETSRLAPQSLYGASKLFCESLVKDIAQRNESGYALLRFGHIYGPGEQEYQKLIPQTIRQLLNGQTPTIYGDGSVTRDFLYVEDAVEATLRAATSKNNKIEPLNIVSGEARTIAEVVQMLAKITGFTKPINFLNDRPVGHSFRFDDRLMRELLGEFEKTPFATGLSLEVADFKKER